MLPLLPTHWHFLGQLLRLLFLINMPGLFRHLLLCYLWFVNVMCAGRNHNCDSARAVHTGRKTCYKAQEAGRLEPQAQVEPCLTCQHTKLEVQKTYPGFTWEICVQEMLSDFPCHLKLESWDVRRGKVKFLQHLLHARRFKYVIPFNPENNYAGQWG